VQDEETAALLNGRGRDYLQGELIGLATSERTWQVEKEQAASGYSSRLLFAAELVQAFLHFIELSLELIHLAARALRLLCRLRLTARKRREHGECLFEHFHISPDLIFERAESANTEGLRYLFPKFALFFRERVN
jgi:hypothetical protein